MATGNDAQAVFHDHATMEEAVRALEIEGVRRRRIHVHRASTVGGVVRKPPEHGGALGAGAAIGLVVGGAIGMLTMLGIDALAPLVVTLRMLGGAATGALLGALVGLVVSRLRHQSRYPRATGYDDFIVQVRADDPASAESVRDLLARAGGDPLPA